MSPLSHSAHTSQSPPASSSVPIQLALVDAGLPVEKNLCFLSSPHLDGLCVEEEHLNILDTVHFD